MIPKCCCDPTVCIIAEDDFGRANETPVASPWSLIDGGGLEGSLPNLSGNKLVFASDGWIKHSTVDPRGAGESVEVEADFTFASFAEAGLVVGLKEGGTDDQWYGAVVRWESGECAYLNLGQYLGTSYLFTCNPSYPGCIPLKDFTAGTYKIQLCLKPNQGSYGYESYDLLRVRITYPDGTIYGTSNVFDNPAGDGDKAGIVVRTGAVDVDNWKYKYFRESPDHRTCPNCNTPCNIIGGKDTGKDPFDDDDACWWVEINPSYTISGGTFQVTGDGAKIQFQLPHPQLKLTRKVIVDVRDSGIPSRVFLGDYIAELSAAHTLALIDADGSTVLDSDTDDIENTGDFLEMTFCISRRQMSVTVTGVTEEGEIIDLCADANLPADADLQGIYASLGGDTGAEFDNFRLIKTYDSDEPSDGCDNCEACPTECLGCCDFPQPAGSYIVDLGIGGWTFRDCVDPATSSCNACEDANGEFLVIATGDCFWRYYDENCILGDLCGSFSIPYFQISLSILNDGIGCLWKLEIKITATVFGDPGDPNIYCLEGVDTIKSGLTKATYYSDYITDTECDTMPVTMTKELTESVEDFCPCGGFLPDEVTLEAVP